MRERDRWGDRVGEKKRETVKERETETERDRERGVRERERETSRV